MIIEKFNKRFSLEKGGCWLWTGSRSGKYGVFNKKFAHRISYEIHIGKIPDGLLVVHVCENALCVNPDHLKTINRSENTANASKAKRAMSPLSEKDVSMIRTMNSIGGRTHQEIAEFYGVARPTISNIVSGKRWTHVKD